MHGILFFHPPHAVDVGHIRQAIKDFLRRQNSTPTKTKKSSQGLIWQWEFLRYFKINTYICPKLGYGSRVVGIMLKDENNERKRRKKKKQRAELIVRFIFSIPYHCLSIGTQYSSECLILPGHPNRGRVHLKDPTPRFWTYEAAGRFEARVTHWFSSSCTHQIGLGILGAQYTPPPERRVSTQPYALYSPHSWFGIRIYLFPLNWLPKINDPPPPRRRQTYVFASHFSKNTSATERHCVGHLQKRLRETRSERVIDLKPETPISNYTDAFEGWRVIWRFLVCVSLFSSFEGPLWLMLPGGKDPHVQWEVRFSISKFTYLKLTRPMQIAVQNTIHIWWQVASRTSVSINLATPVSRPDATLIPSPQ